MKQIVLCLAAATLSMSAAIAAEPAKKMETSAGEVYVDQNGMTLYTFDKDTMGATMSACTGKCLVNWPPFEAGEGAMADDEWTIVEYTDADGTVKNMWAYEGKPLYLYIEDKKAGDVMGDGKGGVWHVAK
jgi:predicted lipoprotein with Yx(FWY)xxD motif